MPEDGISPEALEQLAEFFAATDLATGQQALWPYDFSVIPAEMISSIYEQLLEDTQRDDAAYYTPRRVVDLVLDELIPWQGGPKIKSILDPACGSGIFLAEAFRRVAYRHTHSDQQPPTFDSLSQLLKNTIFGVDQNAAAIGVSAFSLYLALLEHVDPPTAWRDGQLPNLVGSNLLVADFFEDHELASRTFDLVVGNPPWKSALTRPAADYLRQAGIPVPDRQIAHAFLWRSTELLSDGGFAGLVLPSKSFLHNRSNPAEFARRKIFSELDVDTIIDLSPLRRETFGTAINPAAIAIVGRREETSPSFTLHVSPRRTPLGETIDAVVVSQENIRRVPESLAAGSSDVWKALLWGGLADLTFVGTLRETFPSLEYLASQNRWLTGQGFQVRGGDENDASGIVGMPVMSTSAVGALRTFSKPSAVVTAEVMHRPRDPLLFRGPHVIMRKGFRSHPVSVFVSADVAFTDGLFALAGPPADADELRVISALLNSSVARYWYFMTSSSWGVEREQLQLTEYLTLPVPPVAGPLRKEILRIVEDVPHRPASDESWVDALDTVVFSAYGLTPAEQDLVRDGLNLKLGEYQDGPNARSFKETTDDQLELYAATLVEYLNTLGSTRWRVSPSDRANGFAVVACQARSVENTHRAQFSIANLLDQAEGDLENWRSPASVVQPSAIVVSGTTVFILKPDEARSWSKSVAKDDAAEVLSAIVRAPTGNGS